MEQYTTQAIVMDLFIFNKLQTYMVIIIPKQDNMGFPTLISTNKNPINPPKKVPFNLFKPTVKEPLTVVCIHTIQAVAAKNVLSIILKYPTKTHSITPMPVFIFLIPGFCNFKMSHTPSLTIP